MPLNLKRILNYEEEIGYERLNKVCSRHHLHVFAKVRLADVVAIENSGIDRESFSFALKAHLDFTITDENRVAQFAVEYDGAGHSTTDVQRLRDERKNHICHLADLPLLRINAKHLIQRYRGMDLLTWLVETWAAQTAYCEAQAKGHIPLDDVFSFTSIIALDTSGDSLRRENRFPLWLSLPLHEDFRRWFREGKIADELPSFVISSDLIDMYHGIAFIRINEGEGVFTKVRMRGQNFPVVMSDLLEEVLQYEIRDAVMKALQGEQRRVPIAEMYGIVEAFRKRFNPLIVVVRSAN